MRLESLVVWGVAALVALSFLGRQPPAAEPTTVRPSLTIDQVSAVVDQAVASYRPSDNSGELRLISQRLDDVLSAVQDQPPAAERYHRTDTEPADWTGARVLVGLVVGPDGKRGVDPACRPCVRLVGDLVRAERSGWRTGFAMTDHFRLVGLDPHDYPRPRVEYVKSGQVVDSVVGYNGNIKPILGRHPDAEPNERPTMTAGPESPTERSGQFTSADCSGMLAASVDCSGGGYGSAGQFGGAFADGDCGSALRSSGPVIQSPPTVSTWGVPFGLGVTIGPPPPMVKVPQRCVGGVCRY